MKLQEHLKYFCRFLQRENFHLVIFWVVILVLVSSVGIFLLEPDIPLRNAFWWSIVTLTTVGYGDISPVTAGGRVIAVFIMFFGIGLLGMMSATLATILISKKMKEDKGLKTYTSKDHVILCEWNHRARAILKELRTDSQTEEAHVVLIADIDEKPVADESLYFVKGVVDDETLERANLCQAKTVIVLGDDRLEASARDAKVVLTTLTIESMCRDVYTVVELVDQKNRQHCERANADEIIVGSEFSSHLIASAAIHHGISRIVSELLSTQYGNDLHGIKTSEEMIGLPFIDVFTRMKKERQAIVMGIQKGRGGELIVNPPVDSILEQDDLLIVIAAKRA
ncbi:MAG: cag pathogenicity island protein Cag26 [Desulfobulbaceae bacterium]|nr:cag pathogenicity island protein Cag26 [Desulfobulbaceae bacterium]